MVVGQHAFVSAGWEDELHILNVSDPENPEALGFYPTFGMLGWSVMEKGDHLYAAGGFSGPYAINVSKLSPQRTVETANISAETSVAEIKSKYAFIIDQMGILRILDVSNPEEPCQVGHYGSAGRASDVVVRGQVAYILTEEAGLHILDVSDPTTPILIRVIDLVGQAQSLALMDDNLYLVEEAGRLHILNITSPDNPVKVSTSAMPGKILDVAVEGDRAYIAGGKSGVYIVDVSDPSLPIQLGSIQTHSALGVDVSDGKLFIADGLCGLLILIQP
jgi:hypothetical protein